jgi:glycosyltransferase involved in cell wall biosynthesis
MATTAPLVSVVVPVFNGEQYLRQSLDSILAQTYHPIEVLVMDDASSDRTAEILPAYGDRISVFRQPSNRGIYANANDGIARAQGEFIAVYHADDVYEPEIVSREVEFLQRYPEAGAVFCLDVFISTAGREFGRLALPREVQGGRPLSYATLINALLIYRNRFLRCPSAMVRAAVYRDVGPYHQDEFRNNADLDMWLRIARKYPLGILEEHLFRYRWGHENSSRRHRRLRTDVDRHFAIMDRHLEAGARALARSDALDAYEAHRTEDRLLRTVSLYILRENDEARALLDRARPARLLRSRHVQRGRLLVLYLALLLLVRLPWSSLVAALFTRRWHAASA